MRYKTIDVKEAVMLKHNHRLEIEENGMLRCNQLEAKMEKQWGKNKHKYISKVDKLIAKEAKQGKTAIIWDGEYGTIWRTHLPRYILDKLV